MYYNTSMKGGAVDNFLGYAYMKENKKIIFLFINISCRGCLVVGHFVLGSDYLHNQT